MPGPLVAAVPAAAAGVARALPWLLAFLPLLMKGGGKAVARHTPIFGGAAKDLKYAKKLRKAIEEARQPQGPVYPRATVGRDTGTQLRERVVDIPEVPGSPFGRVNREGVLMTRPQGLELVASVPEAMRMASQYEKAGRYSITGGRALTGGLVGMGVADLSGAFGSPTQRMAARPAPSGMISPSGMTGAQDQEFFDMLMAQYGPQLQQMNQPMMRGNPFPGLNQRMPY